MNKKMSTGKGKTEKNGESQEKSEKRLHESKKEYTILN